jgi:hypothetical protein
MVWRMEGARMSTFNRHWQALSEKNPALRTGGKMTIAKPEFERVLRLTWNTAQRECREAVIERNIHQPYILSVLRGEMREPHR